MNTKAIKIGADNRAPRLQSRGFGFFIDLVAGSAAFTTFALALLVLVGCSRSVNVAENPISLTTNEVVRVQTARGGAAIIQFTGFGPEQEALYRWRYRAPQSKTVQSGIGRVVESYDSKAKADGTYEVVPNGSHDTTVRAGDLMLEWSYGSYTNGFLYFDPREATIQVLEGKRFNQKL